MHVLFFLGNEEMHRNDLWDGSVGRRLNERIFAKNWQRSIAERTEAFLNLPRLTKEQPRIRWVTELYLVPNNYNLPPIGVSGSCISRFQSPGNLSLQQFRQTKLFKARFRWKLRFFSNGAKMSDVTMTVIMFFRNKSQDVVNHRMLRKLERISLSSVEICTQGTCEDFPLLALMF